MDSYAILAKRWAALCIAMERIEAVVQMKDMPTSKRLESVAKIASAAMAREAAADAEERRQRAVDARARHIERHRPDCGHSSCSQHYIDTGNAVCIEGEHHGTEE